MSSIDAAIIKALVEHIGGNPDSIPDGTIGGGGGGISLELVPHPTGQIPEMTTNDDNFMFDYDYSKEMLVPGKTVLRLLRKDNTTIDTFLCSSTNIKNIGVNTSQLTYSFDQVNDGNYDLGRFNDGGSISAQVKLVNGAFQLSLLASGLSDTLPNLYQNPHSVQVTHPLKKELGFFTLKFNDPSYATTILLNSIENSYALVRSLFGFITYIMQHEEIPVGEKL